MDASPILLKSSSMVGNVQRCRFASAFFVLTHGKTNLFYNFQVKARFVVYHLRDMCFLVPCSSTLSYFQQVSFVYFAHTVLSAVGI